jgi:hypothetical protein
MHKGFKCLDISTGRIYISRDILFDEFIFPFTALHSMVGARYRSDVLLSPTIDLGDNNFANMANVHTLPLLSAADFCPRVQILGTGAIPNVDTPALGSSGAQNPALAPPGSPIGASDTRDSPDSTCVPSAPSIGIQGSAAPRSPPVIMPCAPPDPASAQHTSLGDLPRCRATQTTLACMSYALPASAPASHVSPGDSRLDLSPALWVNLL